jgi:diacylglycerol O-acyltransferase / wax synthase
MGTTAARLSPLDDSFLAVESPTAHMHVGWAAIFEPPAAGRRPSFAELRAHIGSRLVRMPRCRQKLSGTPLELDAPCWVDDPEFELSRHIVRASSSDFDEVVASCMSQQLNREHPLWELRIAERLEDGRIGVVGKVHHCMVDGIAAVELASLLLDPTREAPAEREDEWTPPATEPGAAGRLRTIAEARIRDQLELTRAAVGTLVSPLRLLGVARQSASAATGSLPRALRPARPVAPLNEPLSPSRHLARVSRPLDDLQRVRKVFGATVNDVYLAAAAGALRRLMLSHGLEPVPLKTMVPVNVRGNGQLDELGNRISFMFIALPCDEPSAIRRLRRIKRATSLSKRGGDPGAADLIMRMVGFGPRTLRRIVAKAVSSPRMFNLVVSNIPGPREPMYMRGCELEEAYPVVPLAEGHALSIGMTTIRDRACFGLYADRRSLGDIDRLSTCLEEATDELLALTRGREPRAEGRPLVASA